jgi:uncharacterized membrane protein YphA (DoxX/SURF4 family)
VIGTGTGALVADAGSAPARFAAAQPWLGTLARAVLAGVLLWAGGAKLTDLAGSVRAVQAYRLLPNAAAHVVGSALPFVEVAVGLLLLFGLATRLAALAAALMLSAFVFGIAAAWARGLSIDCGCFGGGGDLSAGQRPRYGLEIARDLGLLALAGFLIWWPRSRWSVDAWLLDPEDTADDSADYTADDAPEPADPEDEVGDRVDAARTSNDDREEP